MAAGLVLAALNLAAGTTAAIVAPAAVKEAFKQTQVARGVASEETVKQYDDPRFKAAVEKTDTLMQKMAKDTPTLSIPKTYFTPNIETGIPNLQVPILGTSLGEIGYYTGGKSLSSETYENTLISYLKEQGYSPSQAFEIARAYRELMRAEGSADIATQIAVSTGSEKIGGKAAEKFLGSAVKSQGGALGKGAVKTVALYGGLGSTIGGVYEAGTLEAQRQFTQGKFDPQQLAIQTATGGATAGVLGGAIAGLGVSPKLSGRATSKALLGAAYTLDPFEYPGDVLARRSGQIFGMGVAPDLSIPIMRQSARGGVKGSSLGGSLANAFSSLSDSLQSKAGVGAYKKSIYGGSVPVGTQTQTKTDSKKGVVPVSSNVPVGVPSTVPIFSFGTTPVPVPVPVPDTTVPSPVPVPVPSETSSETTTETPAEVPTEIPTTAPTTVPTMVPVSIITPTPKYPLRPTLPFLPAFPIEGGTGRRGEKGRLFYFNELEAAKKAFLGLSPVAGVPTQAPQNAIVIQAERLPPNLRPIVAMGISPERTFKVWSDQMVSVIKADKKAKRLPPTLNQVVLRAGKYSALRSV